MTQFIEIPASKRSIAMRRPLFGSGINNASYSVTPVVGGKKVRCPYYTVWASMIQRCYSDKYQAKQPTYIGCLVVKEWLTFSNFREWMKGQQWFGMELDKDILVSGNRTYSPETCIFVSHAINGLLASHESERGDCPQGVYFDKQTEKYRAQCRINGTNKPLGRFSDANKAEVAYLEFKSALIIELASKERPEIEAALLRYSKAMTDKALAIHLLSSPAVQSIERST